MRFEAENWTKNSDHQLQSNYDVWPWWSNWFAWLESPLSVWACEPHSMMSWARFLSCLFFWWVHQCRTRRKDFVAIFFLLRPVDVKIAKKNHWGRVFFLVRSPLGWLNGFFNGRERFIHMNGWVLSESCKDSDFLDLRGWHGDKKNVVLVAFMDHFTNVTSLSLFGMTTETESRFCCARKR